jgi:hypothetical protein
MSNHETLILIVLFLHMATIVFAQNSKFENPAFNDKYSEYVNQLENGDLNIDYADFRNSFLDSKKFRKKAVNYDSLKKLVGKNACDKMIVKTDEEEATYYFEANKVFEMERKPFEK